MTLSVFDLHSHPPADVYNAGRHFPARVYATFVCTCAVVLPPSPRTSAKRAVLLQQCSCFSLTWTVGCLIPLYSASFTCIQLGDDRNTAKGSLYWCCECSLSYVCVVFILWVMLFNVLNPTGHVMHQQFNIQQLKVLPTLCLCVLYLSENKQRLVPLTA